MDFNKQMSSKLKLGLRLPSIPFSKYGYGI